jgi:5-formyltetrahydrofolate cyclo-ligase
VSGDPRDARDAAGPAAIEAAKHAARLHAREARCALDELACATAATAAAERLLALPEVAHARLVLAYGATPEEIDPAPAVSVLRQRGVAIAFPRVEAPGELGVHLTTASTGLLHGMFGILEPPADAPRAPLSAIDAVIVPGVAFDEKCWRLGYGGGYYDRLLPMLSPGCATIGLAYEEQVLETIPAEEHDVRLTAVVTPARVIRCG